MWVDCRASAHPLGFFHKQPPPATADTHTEFVSASAFAVCFVSIYRDISNTCLNSSVTLASPILQMTNYNSCWVIQQDAGSGTVWLSLCSKPLLCCHPRLLWEPRVRHSNAGWSCDPTNRDPSRSSSSPRATSTHQAAMSPSAIGTHSGLCH